MTEDELIKQLENAGPPGIELKDHRHRLKAALLAGFPLKPRGLAGLIERAGETMLKGLKSPQPVWKPVVLGVVVLAIVAGLMWSTRSPSGQPQVVMAADTIMFGPEIGRAYSDNGVFKDYDIVKFIIDGEVVAAFSQNKGEDHNLTLEIKLEPGELTLAEIEHIGACFPEESDEQRITDIARADAGVQALLAQGVSINKAIFKFMPYRPIIDPKIDLGGATMRILMAIKDKAIVLLERGDEHWLAHVDLVQEKVTELEELDR
jgi:hypothetical protein